MTEAMEKDGGRRGLPWRAIGWGIPVFLLLLPLVTNAPWTLSDYIFAAVAMGSVGAVLELTIRVSRNNAYRAGVGFALAAAFLIIWANGAVGMIGDEDNGYNLLFLGVIALALIGTIIARFRAGGMALVMAAAGAAHLAAAAGGLSADLRGAIVSAVFAGLWLLSAASFRHAARSEASLMAPQN